MDGRWTALDVKLVCIVLLIGIRGSCGFFESEGLAGLAEIQLLKQQLLGFGGTKFESVVPVKLDKYNSRTKLDIITCVNRKFGQCSRLGSSKQLDKPESFGSSINELIQLLFTSLQLDSVAPTSESHAEIQTFETEVSFLRRRLIQGSINRNLPAAPAPNAPPPDNGAAGSPTVHSSGAFPAVPHKSKNHTFVPVPSPLPRADATGSAPKISSQSSSNQECFERIWKYVLIATSAAILFIIAAVMICICQSKAVATIGPRKTGISGQLQKAFVTGVPNLNRSELETACEEFSNIIDIHGGCTIYKGTLSSGVEIAVISASAASNKEWSSRSEIYFRKKVETLSRVNHKNFINLIGYCEEAEPFTRMMVFEYAPNGTLSEHLHVKDAEHLDWNTRMRIIMGAAYCLQYMHDLKPPVAVTNFTSEDVFLTDDYAAKIADTSFWANFMTETKPGEDEAGIPPLPPVTDPDTNVYSFGIMLLEVISGQHPTSKDGGSIVSWASEYLKTRENISDMVDPTLKSFKNDELEAICDVIQDCLAQDPIKRPTMTEVIAKLRQAIAITPEAAIPNMSPLWWAELEILSEAS